MSSNHLEIALKKINEKVDGLSREKIKINKKLDALTTQLAGLSDVVQNLVDNKLDAGISNEKCQGGRTSVSDVLLSEQIYQY